MHHLILLLPLIGIVVFWIFPLRYAIPIYLFILLISGLMYWAIIRAIRRIPRTGPEGLIGAEAVVVSRARPGDEARYIVRLEGELWSANSPDDLKPGETVIVTSLDGLLLMVQRTADNQ